MDETSQKNEDMELQVNHVVKGFVFVYNIVYSIYLIINQKLWWIGNNRVMKKKSSRSQLVPKQLNLYRQVCIVFVYKTDVITMMHLERRKRAAEGD